MTDKSTEAREEHVIIKIECKNEKRNIGESDTDAR